MALFATFYTLPTFLAYIAVAGLLFIAFLFVYSRTTPHSEFVLIGENNVAAAITLGGTLIGFALPIGSLIIHAAHIVDLLLWSVIAFGVQITAYGLVWLRYRNLSQMIEDNKVGPAVFVALVSVAAGILNAACMVY